MNRMLRMLFGCVTAAGLLAAGLWLAPGVEVPADGAGARAALAPEPQLAPAPPGPKVDEPRGLEVDVLRVERDGATLVSGRATPGSEVEILLGEQPAGAASVDTEGNFVAFLTLPESDAPHSLNLRERDAGGTARPGRQSFVVETRRAAPEGAARDDAEVLAAHVQDEVQPLVAPDGGPAPEEGGVAPQIAAAAEGRQVDAGDSAVILKPADPSGEDAPSIAGQAIADVDRPDAPEANVRTAALSDVPTAQEAPVAIARPAPPQPGGIASGTAEGRVAAVTPPVQATMPPDAPAPAAPPGETPAVRAGLPPVSEVPAQPDAPRVLRVENGSLSVLQDGAPRPELSIDTIRYAPDGTVVLGGRAPQATSVRAWLDDRPLEAVESGTDGQWRLDMPALEERTYNLRVDQLDAEGEVVARAETPFRPESAESLDELRGMVEDGVRRVTVQPGFTLWAIAERNYGDGLSFVRVFEANADKIRDPDLIYPGQIFAVPD